MTSGTAWRRITPQATASGGGRLAGSHGDVDREQLRRQLGWRGLTKAFGPRSLSGERGARLARHRRRIHERGWPAGRSAAASRTRCSRSPCCPTGTLLPAVRSSYPARRPSAMSASGTESAGRHSGRSRPSRTPTSGRSPELRMATFWRGPRGHGGWPTGPLPRASHDRLSREHHCCGERLFRVGWDQRAQRLDAGLDRQRRHCAGDRNARECDCRSGLGTVAVGHPAVCVHVSGRCGMQLLATPDAVSVASAASLVRKGRSCPSRAPTPFA